MDPEVLKALSRLKAGDCPEVAELGAFLDGQLREPAKGAIESHLRACPSCLNQLIDLRELERLHKPKVGISNRLALGLRARPEAPPRAVVERVLSLVPREAEERSWRMAALWDAALSVPRTHGVRLPKPVADSARPQARRELLPLGYLLAVILGMLTLLGLGLTFSFWWPLLLARIKELASLILGH